MIKKIRKIKNIGSFWFFDWDEINPDYCKDPQGNIVKYKSGNPKRIQHEFKKYNILFGENGSGKSTLVSIFKSLNDNSKDLKKHWDKESEDREIEIDFDTTTIRFEEHSGWDQTILKDKFLFFDKDFINNYVHSGQIGRQSEHDQRTGEMIVYLGDFYNYQNQLDKLRSFINYLSKENKEFRNSEEQKYNSLFIGIEEFTKEDIEDNHTLIESLNETQKQSFKNAIENKEKELIKIETALKEHAKVENIQNLDLINSLIIQKWFNLSLVNLLLGFTVGSNIIEVLEKIQNKKEFIQKGIELVEEQSLVNCPFCEQKIKNGDYLEIIKQYQQVFDEEFNNKQKEVKEGLKEYKIFLESLLKIPTSIPSYNQQRFNEMKRYCAIEKELPVFNFINEEQELLLKELEIIRDKNAHIIDYFESIGIEKIKQIAEKCFKFIEEYNSFVEEINKMFEQYKKDLKEGKKEEEKNRLLNEIKDLKIKLFIIDNQQDLKRYMRSKKLYEANEYIISNLNKIFDMLRDKINEKFKDFATKYFEKTKKYIQELNPSLQFKMKCKAQYNLRTKTPVVCGFEILHKGKDRLTELSEGERQVIALAFFIALLDCEKQKSEKIVIFDDPITSFDAGKRRNTAELIYKKTFPFMQTFIFTCDPLFKQYCIKVRNSAIKNNKNQYYILKSGTSSIHYVSKENATICSSFKYEFKNIRSIPGTDENIVIYGQKLRFCIETDIKEKYLGYDKDSLDNILDTIQSAKIDKLRKHIDRVRNIYNYCNTGGLAHYPRDGATSWTELMNYIKQYLSLNL